MGFNKKNRDNQGQPDFTKIPELPAIPDITGEITKEVNKMNATIAKSQQRLAAETAGIQSDIEKALKMHLGIVRYYKETRSSDGSYHDKIDIRINK